MSHWDDIGRAIEAAVAAGFAVEFRPLHGGAGVRAEVTVHFMTADTASDRLCRTPLRVDRASLTDAAANALQVVMLEIGLDEEARAKAVERFESEAP